MKTIKAYNRIGQKFGRLTIKDIVPKQGIKKERKYCLCDCDCGRQNLKKRLDGLTTGKIIACSTYCSRDFRGNLPKGNKNPSYKGTEFIPATYFWDLKHSAKKRKKYFNLTIDDLHYVFKKQKGKCIFTGLDIGFGPTRSPLTTASLDRIDSSKGYIKGNIQWVHKDINMMKSIYNNNYFIKMCSLVYKNNLRKI